MPRTQREVIDTLVAAAVLFDYERLSLADLRALTALNDSKQQTPEGREELYPQWEFEAHVGYSTPEHRAAIERHGISPLHRMSFQSVAYSQLTL